LSVNSLPGHVVAPQGQLTLYADYADVGQETVALYLVNRTEHRLGFDSQDGDIYVKLEAMTGEDRWERAQTHLNSWCGNSYMVTPSLRPGEYFRFVGYAPSEGETRSVRYRAYNQSAYILNDDTPDRFDMIRRDLEKMPLDLVSNVGTGKVPPEAIEAARRDALATQFGTFETVRDLALGITKAGGLGQSRSTAVQALGRFPKEESLAVVRELLADADAAVGAAAMRALAQMGLKLESAEELYQKMLRSDDVQLRAAALHALDERPITPEVILFAKEQLAHDDLVVRVMAMIVLGSRCKEEPQIKAYINSIYDDPDPKIQSVFETILISPCINYQDRGYKGKFRER
jgi:hypothetical protein